MRSSSLIPPICITVYPVYRDLQKTDKGKKGGSRAKGKEPDNASSTTSKSRGKGKEKEPAEPSDVIPNSRARPPPQRPSVEQNEDLEEEDEVVTARLMGTFNKPL